MGLGDSLGHLGTPNLQSDDRLLQFKRPLAALNEGIWTTNRFEKGDDHLSLFVFEKILHVVACVEDRLVSARNQEIEPDSPVAVGDRQEDGTTLGNDTDRSSLQRWRDGGAVGSHPVL